MIIFVDTNVLLRLDHLGHPHRELAKAALERIVDEQHTIRTIPQVLYEYWVVATRPLEANGLGFSTDDTARMLSDFKELFPPLRDERGILEHWENLVQTYKVQGKAAHDARIVAAMLRHGLTHLITFNAGDFARFSDVTVMTPDDIVSGAQSL
ncbi:type II toxin-antitoxin system VapC family toxin [Bythopirellula goksoeyrii]|uniref:tRNA(fMet)-specific endonuclease VapC n=1 Tax=Bythopirellula goksoeyrii TaxID=1400387 RepID=A0A5B9Q7A7_9BACT|nr:type II toxin-antitoxin system VapC family toxin [Bythopirellula goksoeyrii]QEG34908.1 tRNA(fMet)-specific endonuclease VapC [Bythopirellula goksoeyrii]